MKFPNKKFFGLINDGWEDLGYIERLNDGNMTKTKIHLLCNSRARIGKDESGLFIFCHRCLVKLKEE